MVSATVRAMTITRPTARGSATGENMWGQQCIVSSVNASQWIRKPTIENELRLVNLYANYTNPTLEPYPLP